MKKKLWIVSLLSALFITAATGALVIKSGQSVITTEATADWTIDGEIDTTYLYGTFFDVPDAFVEMGEENVVATSTVTYPDGTVTNTKKIPLNQAGEYTVTYRASANDTHYLEKKQFTVNNSSYLTQSEKSSVRYGTYTEFGANSEGLLVRLAQNDTLTFSQLIDVSALTGAENLFETFITPNIRGAYDFNKLTITLTDAMDSSTYLRFQLKRYIRDDRGINVGYVTVNGNGQLPVGYEYSGSGDGAYHINNQLGTPITLTFSATMHQNNAWSGMVVDRAPDAGKCTLMFNPFTMETKASGKHIAHLNNLMVFEEAWTPWPSGKARLTISAEELKSETANFCITEIFGVDLRETVFSENEAPIITTAMEQDEMPKGEVGREYTIPTATAFDSYSGDCDVSVSVYRDYVLSDEGDAAINVSVVDGKFKPTVAGWHTIVYKASDAFGNSAQFLLSAYIENDLGKIEVYIPDDTEEQVELGEKVEIPSVTYSGDCGIASVKTTMTHDGETTEIEDGFVPVIAGEYTIMYTVTDYVGRIGTGEYIVMAVPGEGYKLLNDLVLPQVYVSDCEYVLPTLYAVDYSSGRAEQYLCNVVVTDKDIARTYKAGDAFVPSVAENGDKITVSYQYGGQELAVKEVPAVLVKGTKNNVNVKNYLSGNGFSTSFKDDNDQWLDKGIVVIADGEMECCGWTFATPQIADGFIMEMQGIATRAKQFDALKITFTDSLNIDEQISIEATVEKGGTTLIIGEKVLAITSSTLLTNEKYAISYENKKIKWNDTGITVDKTVNGDKFDGFSSGFIYVRVEMLNAKEGAGYILLNICNSWLSRYNLESYKPNFKILGEFAKEQSIDTVYELYPAIANDVFAPNTLLTLTVIAPDGSIVRDVDGVLLENVKTDKSYFINLTQYGQYKATYYAVEKDWVKENPLEEVKSIFVIDEIAPQVHFTNATQTTATVGDVLILPDFEAQDNLSLSEELKVLRGVFNPMGKYIYFEDDENAIRCAYAGEYVFFVMVFDGENNITTIRHTVTVTKK